MATTFVSNRRRVRFELTLRIIDLNNVPLVSGTSFVKWHLPASTAAEHRGKTAKCAIRDHRVQYAYEKEIPVRLVVGRDGMLQECRIELECLQEYSAGGRGERIVLGHVHLNLAEYAGDGEAAAGGGGNSPGGAGSVAVEERQEEGITRRYLMQDSKINSTLKIGIAMRHLEGTKEYSAPALRTAPVFGGIAGIMSSAEPVASAAAAAAAAHHGVALHVNGEQADGAGGGGADAAMANFGATNREMGEMQDMYRRTLAAFWASQPGELRADECIEDIFAGGDGWGKGGRPTTRGEEGPDESGSSTPNPDGDVPSRESSQKSGPGAHMGRRHNFVRHHHKGRFRKMPGELDEMDVRQDMISWHVGERAVK